MQLQIENLSKSYGSNKALNGFTATLEPGIYALLGPNGSGKSTFMNLLTDNLKKDAGRILRDGKDIRENMAAYREKIGFMPQYSGMYPNFTLSEFLWYVARLKGLDRKSAQKQITELLRAVELDSVADKKIKSMSGGMKQRLSLAQALLGDPELLILDEPTAGLDPKQRIAIRNYIAQVALNKIVLIATHVVSDVEFIAREIIMLKKGVIVDRDTTDRLAEKVQGKVFTVLTDEQGLADLQKQYRVTNIQKTPAGIRVRILCEQEPDPAWETVKGTLEDYYLLLFGEAGTAETE